MASIFGSHIRLAHHYWKMFLEVGDYVVDATCGNGKDTLALAKLVTQEGKGKVIGMDIQKEALKRTTLLLKENLSPSQLERIELVHASHASFPGLEAEIKLFVYNLGYLPHGDKTLTTLSSSTLESIQAAIPLLKAGGAISVTCYPGHPEGAVEQKNILHFLSSLSSKEWTICHHSWINRYQSPTLVFLQRSDY